MQGRIVGCLLIALVDFSAVMGTVDHARVAHAASEPAGAANQAPQLPLPNGPYGVGRIGFDWIDASRPASCYRKTGSGREMMVYLWYPSSSSPPETHGLYVPHARAIDALPANRAAARDIYGSHWDQMVTGEIDSHASESAPVAARPAAFPVLLFSPGVTASQFSYTSLIEDFVSHGYVVAAIEHPCSTDLAAFPDGRVALREDPPAPASPDSQPSLQQMMAGALDAIAEGAADDRFVLDQLTRLNGRTASSFPLAGRLDLHRIAVAGHSAGGSIAARACQLDARIRACVDFEGELIPVELFPDFSDGAKFRQPIFAMEIARGDSEMGGSHTEHEQYFRKREAQLLDCPAGSYYVSLRGADMVHASFSDGPLLNAPDAAARAQAETRLALIENLAVAFLQQSFQPEQIQVLTQNSAPAADVVIRPLGNQQ